MIRFRIGQRWKREPAGSPVDSFGLDLEGVDLLAGASAERLDVVVPELVEAVRVLHRGESELAQVSLPEVHRVLALARAGTEVKLQVVSLTRPARLVRPPITVDLEELATAASACGRQLVDDVREAHLPAPRKKSLLRALSALEGAPRPSDGARREFRSETPAPPCGFGLALLDAENLAGRLGSVEHGALTSLLARGRMSLRGEGDEELWSAEGLPYLFALELARQAAELSHAIDLHESRFVFRPGGLGAELVVRIAEGQLEIGGRAHPFEAKRLVREMFNLALTLPPVYRAHNTVQGKNPYLLELVERSREGLAHVREVLPPKTPRPAKGQRASAKKEKPLTHGKLRRLRFEPLWTKERLSGGDEPGRLLPTGDGPIFASSVMALGLSAAGEIRFRRVATGGLAAAPSGEVVVADRDRVELFEGAGASARWFYSHDGVPIGPELKTTPDALLTVSQARAVICWSRITGRELWRLAPMRTQRIHLSVQGHRALVATDTGHLYGVELGDGQVRFRITAPLPFIGPPVPWGRRAVGVLGRRDATGLVVIDADSGAVGWTAQLELARPSAPLPRGRRVAIAGERGGEGVLISLSSDGKLVWERPLPQERPPYFVTAIDRFVLVSGGNGAASLFDAEGNLEWRVGATHEEPIDLAPSFSRGVLILPGDPVRAIDVHGGRVLGEVKIGPGLCDLHVDRKLNLYLLNENGTLQAFHLRSHFAVVG